MAGPVKEIDREIYKASELEKFQKAGSVIVDDRRRRPLWFDGRFLDAAALNQQQQYYISKQEDIGQLLGTGIISGLQVTLVENKSRTIVIGEGRGLTPAGKLVLLEDDIEIDLADLGLVQAMNLAFDISQLEKSSLSNASGIYIVGLRPVEFSAEPITSYPTEINGKRSIEDSSIFDATAIVLIPYSDQGSSSELAERRKHIAHEIFVRSTKKGQPANVLPLALLALNMGVIEWIDPLLVRRMLSTGKHEMLGLGMAPRPLREAHFLQYREQLKEILHARASEAFAAAEEFISLPPAGPLPMSAVNIEEFSQTWFPAGVQVDLSFIPDDEIYSLLEDSFSMPPILLEQSEEDLASTSVMILLAVPRHKIRALSLKLPEISTSLKSVAADAISGQTPIEVLSSLGIEESDVADLVAANTVWREAFTDAQTTLWYTRRRNVNFKTEVVGEPVPLLEDEELIESEIDTVAQETKSADELSEVNLASTTAAKAEVSLLLGKVRSSPLIFRSAINDLRVAASKTEVQKLNRLSALGVSERFAVAKFGEGVQRLGATALEINENEVVAESITRSGKLPELDKLSSQLPEADLRVFSKELIETATSGDGPQPEKVAKLIDDKNAELGLQLITSRIRT